MLPDFLTTQVMIQAATNGLAASCVAALAVMVADSVLPAVAARARKAKLRIAARVLSSEAARARKIARLVRQIERDDSRLFQE